MRYNLRSTFFILLTVSNFRLGLLTVELSVLAPSIQLSAIKVSGPIFYYQIERFRHQWTRSRSHSTV